MGLKSRRLLEKIIHVSFIPIMGTALRYLYVAVPLPASRS